MLQGLPGTQRSRVILAGFCEESFTAAGSPAQAEDELEHGRITSLEEDTDELAPLPPPRDPRPGGGLVSSADLLSSQSFAAQTDIVHLVCLSSLFKCATQCHTGLHASSGLNR